MKAADITKLKLLHKDGVKEIEIRGTLYKATADYERRKSHAAGGLGAIGKHLKTIMKKPNDVTPDGLRVMLTLKTDKRFGEKAVAIGEKTIESLASDVVNNNIADEDYLIITNSGQKISPKEIFVKSIITVDADGKTVNRDKTWKEIYSFFLNLKNTGVLEQ